MAVINLKPTDNVIEKAKRANSRSKKALKVFNSIIRSLKVLRTIKMSVKAL